MRKLYRILLAASLAIGLGACDEELIVENENNPDMLRALARPGDVELLIVGSYNTSHGATYGFAVAPQLMNLGMMNYSNLANNGMSVRSIIPRPPIANSRNSTGSAEGSTTFNALHRAARTAALGLSRVQLSTFTFFPTSIPQNERAKAFAHFVMGISMGQLAMIFDSASAIDEDDDPADTAPAIAIVGYDSLARYALARLDSAHKYAGLMGTQTIPNSWMALSGGLNMNVAQFQALIAAWKVRIRANVARTPAEAAAVNWAQVETDANTFLAGWAGDVSMRTNTVAGWDVGVMVQLYASSSTNWHEMHGFMAGMADTLGGYQAWLDTPDDLRQQYPIVSTDRRWPNGGATCNSFPASNACRTAQQAILSTTANLYFQNRTSDWFGDAIGNSQYRYGRWLTWSTTSSRLADIVTIARGEISSLSAEANIRQSDFAGAATMIDLSRVTIGQLPGVGAGVGGQNITDNTTLVRGGTAALPGAPGAASCIPRVPSNTGAGFTTSCANLTEAMKWEHRMETAYTWPGGWYFLGRRWGDLPEGTASMYPLPHQETDARGNPPNFYTTGGAGSTTGAPKGTYGI